MDYTNSKEYKKMMGRIGKQKKEDNTWKAVVTLCKDTELVYFLDKNYPDIMQEFYQWKLDKAESVDVVGESER